MSKRYPRPFTQEFEDKYKFRTDDLDPNSFRDVPKLVGRGLWSGARHASDLFVESISHLPKVLQVGTAVANPLAGIPTLLGLFPGLNKAFGKEMASIKQIPQADMEAVTAAKVDIHNDIRKATFNDASWSPFTSRQYTGKAEDDIRLGFAYRALTEHLRNYYQAEGARISKDWFLQEDEQLEGEISDKEVYAISTDRSLSPANRLEMISLYEANRTAEELHRICLKDDPKADIKDCRIMVLRAMKEELDS